MKLVGVELINFACFERQFVPLRPGINLLVGRNNAGKTAILRGLSALAALPLSGPPQIPIDVAGYCREGSATFGFEILYQLEESEIDLFHLPDGVQNTAAEEELTKVLSNHLKNKEAIARWRFTAFPFNRMVVFTECAFELPPTPQGKRETVAFMRVSGGINIRNLRFPDLVADKGSSVPTQQYGAPDGGQYPLFESGPLSMPLRVFGTVKTIDPHRVVLNRQGLQTTQSLPSNAQTLGPFLQTLQGNDRETFERIEAFVTRVFPEFRYLSAASVENNQVAIYLTERSTSRRIPLENCGTGVEQIISLATFILTTPKPGTILLDEPHSYLHPTAERALVGLLQESSEHFYVVSTHSAVLMNSVPSDRITLVTSPGQPYKPVPDQTPVAGILLDLGYRNSDALFYDNLVFVEGKSDKLIIPKLLEKDGEIDQAALDRTGFPVLEGAGKGSTGLQTSVLRYERLLSSIAGRDQPRLYILDGDRKEDDKKVLLGTKNPVTLKNLPIKFLPKLEIENYLLVPEAIASAITEERVLKGEQGEISAAQVKEYLDGLLASDDQRLYPYGKSVAGDHLKEVKGSIVLDRLYDRFGLSYHKEHSGLLIAKYITARNQPAISELTDLVRQLFPKGAQ